MNNKGSRTGIVRLYANGVLGTEYASAVWEPSGKTWGIMGPYVETGNANIPDRVNTSYWFFKELRRLHERLNRWDLAFGKMKYDYPPGLPITGSVFAADRRDVRRKRLRVQARTDGTRPPVGPAISRDQPLRTDRTDQDILWIDVLSGPELAAGGTERHRAPACPRSAWSCPGNPAPMRSASRPLDQVPKRTAWCPSSVASRSQPARLSRAFGY